MALSVLQAVFTESSSLLTWGRGEGATTIEGLELSLVHIEVVSYYCVTIYTAAS